MERDVSLVVRQGELAFLDGLEIQANFDECEAAVAGMMEPYATMVIREDDVAAAKKDRARIRKIGDGLDEVRKTVRDMYLRPYNRFEERIRKIKARCDESVDNLDRQIKGYEGRVREEKLGRLRAFYDENAAGDVWQYLPWERVYRKEWGNKGYAEEQAKADISEAIERTKGDVAAIRGLNSRYVAALLEAYQNGAPLEKVLQKSADMERLWEQENAIRKREEERREAARREEEERREAARREAEAAAIRAEERKRKAEQELREIEAAREAERKRREDTERTAREKEAEYARRGLVKLDFRVWVSEKDAVLLREFLQANRIPFEPVPD